MLCSMVLEILSTGLPMILLALLSVDVNLRSWVLLKLVFTVDRHFIKEFSSIRCKISPDKSKQSQSTTCFPVDTFKITTFPNTGNCPSFCKISQDIKGFKVQIKYSISQADHSFYFTHQQQQQKQRPFSELFRKTGKIG